MLMYYSNNSRVQKEKAQEEPCLIDKRGLHQNIKPPGCPHFALLRYTTVAIASADTKGMTKYFLISVLSHGLVEHWQPVLSVKSELAFRLN